MGMTDGQSKAIYEYLLDGHTHTPKEAFEIFGATRLGGQIFHLRKYHNIDIKKRIVTVPNRNGKNSHVAQYYVESEI